MGIQCHHQTKVSLTNLEVHLQKNYTGCRKTLIIILLLLLERIPFDVKSFSIVFMMSSNISIYTNKIAQHNQFEHIPKRFNMFRSVHFKMVICKNPIQSATWIWEILVTFCYVLLGDLLFLALRMGIPINGFN